MSLPKPVRRVRRRLSTESLEPRVCLSAVRIVSWNTANAPNNSAEDALYQTVFEAIGNENVAGNSIRPSIIALQETDNSQSGGNSIARIDAILESLYPQTTYARAVTMLDSGDDATGFVFDTSIFELVSTSVVAETPGMQNFAHHVMRGQFRPIGTNGPSDFYLYTTHLKAGSSAGDANRREAEANAIRVDIESLGPGQDVVVMGDFNIAGSSEDAYQEFLASGVGQLFDPIDTPGEWKNNASFKSVHTQNPAENGAGGMDDRYDFQLASGAVFDNEGLQFIEGSYHAFGNNGTHTFNSDIKTGFGAAPNVLDALANASDHLPVVVDYEIGVALPGVSIDTNGSPISVTEGGSETTYALVLDTIPLSDVVVTISTDGQTRVNGQSQATLTFTPATAFVPQVVNVRAVDDSVVEGAHSGRLDHSISSSDTAYNSLRDVLVDVVITDNDAPNVLISEIMYNPASSEPAAEWVEIVNLGPGSVDISGWQLDDEDDFDGANWSPLPPTLPIAEGGVAIIHSNDIDSTQFRDRWSIEPDVAVIGARWGSLANGPSLTNERLQLLDAGGEIQDEVNYDDDGSTWPRDNGAASIYLTDVMLDNSEGTNWAISVVGVDEARNPTGGPFSTGDIGSPGSVPGLTNDPPIVLETRVADDIPNATQRSIVRRVTVVFDQIVNVSSAAFVLTKRDAPDPGTSVDLNISSAIVNDRTEVTLSFSGNHVDSAGSLTDGNYTLTAIAAEITASGRELDGDRDGGAGGDYSFGQSESDRFFRLFGDSDGDQDVDAGDLQQLGLSLMTTSTDPLFNPIFDANHDGDVDSVDLAEFRKRFLRLR